MTPQAAEAWKRITGQDPPKPFDQKTPEEQLRDRDLFLQTVRDSSDEEDDAVDDLFRNIRMDLHLRIPDLTEIEEESA